MSLTTLYHNQCCSKSRGVQAILLELGVDFSVVNYLEHPPTAEKLMQIAEKGGFAVTDLVRYGETLAKELGLAPTQQRDDLQWCNLLAKHPLLIERPIVETEDDAVIGRPPERVLALFD